VDINQTFLHDAKKHRFHLRRLTFGNVQLQVNGDPTPFFESVHIPAQRRFEAELIEQWRMQEIGDGAQLVRNHASIPNASGQPHGNLRIPPREFAFDAGEFVEWAEYSGNRYGTLRSELTRTLERGRPVVLEIELQGARQVREKMPEAIQVFIDPPTAETLRTRLVGRGTDTPDEVKRRLETADAELAAKPEFPHVVINDRLEDAVDALVDIVRRELATA